MNYKFFVIITISMVNIHSILSQSQSISCTYFTSVGDYACNLEIINPNGFNNFTGINGTHLPGYTNDDVKVITSTSRSSTLNVPSILCDTFKNTWKIVLYLNKIQRIDDYSFENCEELSHLELISNLITHFDEDSFEENTKLKRLYIGLNPFTDLPKDLFDPLKSLTDLSISRSGVSILRPEWFEPLENLEGLWIYENEIESFQKNIFKPLKNLKQFHAQKCNLKEIHSNSFGIHPQLTTISFHANEIDAIDERIIDNTNVTNFYMTLNRCADVNITDTSTSRETMRDGLRNCFDNYDELYPVTTTSTTSTTPDTSTITTTSSESTTTTEPSTTTTTEPSTTTSTISTTTTEFSTTTNRPLPPGCNAGNLDERVCEIEDIIEEFNENFKNIKDDKEDLNETLDNQSALIAEIIEENKQQQLLIEELQKELKAKSDNFASILEGLQEQVLIWSTRPCSCQ